MGKEAIIFDQQIDKWFQLQDGFWELTSLQYRKTQESKRESEHKYGKHPWSY
jgi:hypothetical protein